MHENYLKHHAERLAKARVYRESHREAVAVGVKAWKVSHRTEINAAARKYYAAHPGISARISARQKWASLSQEERAAIAIRREHGNE